MRVTGIDLKLSLQQSIVQRSADLADAAAIGFDGFTVQVLAADGVAVFRLAGLDGLADGEALTRQENRAVQVAGSYGDVSLAAGRTAAVAGGVGAEALLGAALLPIMIGALLLSDILYMNSPSSVLFWILLGSWCRMMREPEGENKYE